MKPGRRIALAVCLSALVVAGAFALATFRSKERPAEVALNETVRTSAPKPVTAVEALSPGAAPSAPATVRPVVGFPPAVEQPIEEILGEHGEDPEAVYYMSRVREAVREGNPSFAREIFRHFKTQHPSSVLIEEAEALLARGR